MHLGTLELLTSSSFSIKLLSKPSPKEEKMSKPVAVEDNTFEQVVLKAEKPVLVDFWATWCKPCLIVAPILDELAEKYSDKVNFVNLDVESNAKTASNYGVMSMPTLLIFNNGEPVSHIVGARPKSELKKHLDAVLV